MSAIQNLNLETPAEGLRELGFTAEVKLDPNRPTYLEPLMILEAAIETGRGTFDIHATYGGMRMGKPNGTHKYYWGTEKQCLAMIRQTMEEPVQAWIVGFAGS